MLPLMKQLVELLAIPTGKATSHSTRLPKDGNQVAGYKQPEDGCLVVGYSHPTKAASCQVIGYGYSPEKEQLVVG